MYYLQFSQAVFYDFCLAPRKQQLQKHQPISWIEALRNSRAKQEARSPDHSTYFFYHWTNKQMTEWKGSARCAIGSANSASNWDSFNHRRPKKKKKCVSETELSLSWFVVSFWTGSIFQAPSPSPSRLDRRKKLLLQTLSRWLSIFPRC